MAARPTEWLHSASWEDLHANSVELQRGREDDDNIAGLTQIVGAKVVARAKRALLSHCNHHRHTPKTTYEGEVPVIFLAPPTGGAESQGNRGPGRRAAPTYARRDAAAPR